MVCPDGAVFLFYRLSHSVAWQSDCDKIVLTASTHMKERGTLFLLEALFRLMVTHVGAEARVGGTQAAAEFPSATKASQRVPIRELAII